MKHSFHAFLLLVLSLSTQAASYNPSVYNALKSQYSSVKFNEDFNGWYLLQFETGGQTLYAMSDHTGNIVVTNATDYRMHRNFIEFHLVDAKQRKIHDQWKVKMEQYEKDYRKYQKVENEYELKLNDYNARYASAEQYAKSIYNQKRDSLRQEAKKANEAKRAQQKQESTGNVWGDLAVGLVKGIADAVDEEAAAKQVKYEPILQKVLSDRNLLNTKPQKPYNPVPQKPAEPADGSYWKGFSFLQPCPYDDIDFEAMEKEKPFINVRKLDKHGLTDAEMNEIIPCRNTEKVLQSEVSDDAFLIKVQGKCGLLNRQAKYVLPCEYEKIVPSEGYLLCKQNKQWGIFTLQGKEFYPCSFQDVKLERIDDQMKLLTQINGLWGLKDFTTGETLLPNGYEKIEPVKRRQQSFFLVKKNAQYGLYSHKGVLLVPPAFDEITLQDMGHDVGIRIKKGDTYSLLDADGNTIIPGGKYIAYVYADSLFYVQQPSGTGILDALGNEMVPCLYSNIELGKKNKKFFIAKKNNLMGIVDFQGNELFDFQPYKDITDAGNYLVVLTDDKRYGALSLTGEMLVKPKEKATGKIHTKIEKDKKAQAAFALSGRQAEERLNQAYLIYKNKYEQSRHEHNTFSFFAQNYVERIVNEWQKREEFEKTDDWHKRVNADTRQQKVYMLTKQAQNDYITRITRHLPDDSLYIVGNYDSDNETYHIRCHRAQKDILVPVPVEEAMEFKTFFRQAAKRPVFFVDNDSIDIAEYVFRMPDGKTYKYNNQASLTYNIANVDYSFDAITYDKTAVSGAGGQGKQTISSVSISSANSDVDYQIPSSDAVQENVFVYIWANQNYKYAPPVEYAFNDGVIFKDYCQKTLGIPAENIRFRNDATGTEMRIDIGGIREVANSDLYRGKCRFIIYYTGHGMPNESGTGTFLMPIDADVTNVNETGVKINDLYDVLSEMQAESVVFLDACFSGMTKAGTALATTKAFYKVANNKLQGDCVVFSATSGSEVAHQYSKKGHSLFTYFLLKKLQESKGEVTYGDLYDYLNKQVQKTALLEVKKNQTPSVNASEGASNWRTRKLK